MSGWAWLPGELSLEAIEARQPAGLLAADHFDEAKQQFGIGPRDRVFVLGSVSVDEVPQWIASPNVPAAPQNLRWTASQP